MVFIQCAGYDEEALLPNSEMAQLAQIKAFTALSSSTYFPDKEKLVLLLLKNSPHIEKFKKKIEAMTKSRGHRKG